MYINDHSVADPQRFGKLEYAAYRTVTFFNSEIFGAAPPVENDPAFPGEAPPEPKPVEEVAVDPEAPEEPTPDEDPDESGDESDTDDDGGALPEPVEDEYVGWAKKQYGDDLDLENEQVSKLAKAAYEKEKMLGRKAEEARTLQQEAAQREVQAKIDFLNTPGVLTPEEDAWIDEAVASADPEEAADALLTEGRADLYGAFIARWVQQGDREAMQALQHRDRVMQWATQPQPSEAESYTAALGQTFVSLGLNIEQTGPLILSKAEELGMAHPSVAGMMSQDPDVRRIATRAIYDLATQGNVTVQKAKTDDVVAQRVQEEELRRGAAGINGNGARVDQPKKSKFEQEWDDEVQQRGWDGERPRYGTE